MSETPTHDVTLVGCGLMGAALAKNFAERGLKVAAWNRSPARAEALATFGVSPFGSIADAVRAADLVIACTATYDTTRTALEPVTDWAGKTLVNVGTGTPTEAENHRAWAAERGTEYLDGAVLCYPAQIGTDSGMILYSGSATAWAQHQQTLLLPGPYSMHVSDAVGVASVLDTAIVGGFFCSALNAYVEAATYAFSQGVSPDILNTISELTFQTLVASGREAVEAITTDQHETDQATLGTYTVGCRATLGVMQAAGFKARTLAATVDSMNEAGEAGLADKGFFALTKVAR